MYETTNQEILSLLQLIRMLENWNRGFYSFRHFIFTKVSAMTTQMKIMPAQQMNLQVHLLKKLMETLQKLSSHMLMQTDLKEKLNKICCNHIKSQWVPPSFASLHWDS